MPWFLIDNGEVIQKNYAADSPGQEWVEGSDDVAPGYLYDGENFTAPAPDLALIEIAKTAQMKAEMYRVLSDGFQWRATNSDDWFTVCIDQAMQDFLTRTLLKLNEGRVSPHGGFIRSKGVSVLIDDVGMRELCLFAGVWGDAVSAVRITELDAVADWLTFNPYAVDWSVNWTGDDASNGWTDKTLTQAP